MTYDLKKAAAQVALAIQKAGDEAVHQDFLAILEDLRATKEDAGASGEVAAQLRLKLANLDQDQQTQRLALQERVQVLEDAARRVLRSRHDDLDTGSINWVAVLDCHLRKLAELLGESLETPDAPQVDLSGMGVPRSVFRNADLQGADFRNANLDGALFDGASMRGVSMQGAHVTGAGGLEWGSHHVAQALARPDVPHVGAQRFFGDPEVIDALQQWAGLEPYLRKRYYENTQVKMTDLGISQFAVRLLKLVGGEWEG